MSGTVDGALKTAAQAVGCSVAEYLDRLNAGELWCWRDQAWEPAEDFGKDSSRPSGRATSCRRSTNAAARRSYQPKQRVGRPGPDPSLPRDGDKKQARQRVNVEVRSGRRPHPNTLPCTDCGHVWTEGEKRHEYDHHLGYLAEHHLHVEPVCTTCHAARERSRG